MIRNKLKPHPKTEHIFYFICAAILLLLYQLIYWNKTYPITEGWGLNYSNLVIAGKFPYRDFYYYLPPLNLLIDTILWKLSFGYLLLYRAYRIVERFIVLFLLYELLCKVAKPFYACLGSFMGILLYTATVYDLCGDYNQTTDLILIILGFLILDYLNYLHDSNSTKQYRCLLGIGIVLGLALLIKQTVFVAALIITFLTLTALYVVEKGRNLHDYIISIAYTFMGFAVPIVPTFIFLQINGALIPFFQQVFINTGSKGSVESILTSIFRLTLDYKNIYIGITVAFCFYAIIKSNSTTRLIYAFIMVSTLYFSFQEKINTVINLKNTDKGYFVAIGIVILLIVSIILDVVVKKIPYLRANSALFILGLVAVLLILPHFKTSCQRLYNETDLFSLISDIPKLCSIGCFILILYCLYKYARYHDIMHAKWLILIICGVITLYYNGMTAKDNFSARSLIIVFPVLFCFIMQKTNNCYYLKMSLCFIICSLFITGTISQKVTNAYSWWGWSETILDEDHICTPNIPAFRGIRLSADEANMYNELCHVLQENTDTSDTIYSFPHIKLFNVVLNNTNMKGSFVPVPFYDVCADEYAINDAKSLSKDPPEILIWCDIPDCMETHESIFRDGEPLGQRYIQRLFRTYIKQKKYTLIGQYNNIFIYKLNDGTDIGYTYIQDEYRENQTLMQN